MLKRIVLSACVTLMVSSAYADAERFTLDSSHTTVAFLVDHVGFAKTLGYFSDVSGSFAYDADTRTVSDVAIVVQTASVQSDNKARDKHVRSKDFLNVKKHPEMRFSADSATVNEEGLAEVSGKLSLLGTTQPLILSMRLNKAAKYPFGHKLFTLGVSGRGSLQRSAYGMNYGVANAMVGDDIELIIEAEANQQQ